jgi:tight adherence protein C
VIPAALAIVGLALLAMLLTATKRTRRRERPASRSPCLTVAGSGQPGNAAGARRAPPVRSSPTRSPATRPGVVSSSRAVPAFSPRSPLAPAEFERPALADGSPHDGQEPARPEVAARSGSVGRRGRVIAIGVTGAVATVGVALLVGRGPGLVALAASGGVLLVRRSAARRAASKLRAERAAAAPAVIDLLGACLLAGLNPYRSLLRVAQRSPAALRGELARAAAELDMGRTPAAALRAVGERTSLDELRAAAAALDAAERWGAPPAEALAARAEALRSRARLRAEAEAGRAAVRLAFPLVFCFLPAFVLLVVVPTMAGALRVLAP